MEERLVTRDQKNALHDHAVESGLNPQEFDWEKRRSRNDSELLVSAIVHLPTGYYFVFDFAQQGRHPLRGDLTRTEYQVESLPGDDTSPQVHQCRLAKPPLQYALHWLDLVKRDLETPDLWEEIARQRRFLAQSTSSDVEDTPFSPDEVRLIVSRLDQILEEVVSTHSVQKEQARVLEERFEYLKQASRRLGRKDWIFATIGAFSVISNYLLAPAASRDLFSALMNLIREMVNIRLLLP